MRIRYISILLLTLVILPFKTYAASLETIVSTPNKHYGEIEMFPPTVRTFTIQFTQYEPATKQFSGTIEFLEGNLPPIPITGSIVEDEIAFKEQNKDGVYTLSIKNHKVQGEWHGKTQMGEEIIRDVWFEMDEKGPSSLRH